MKAERVSITKAKQRLGELVKRASYGGERIILEFRDRPQAAIVSIEDLERITKMDDRYEEQLAVLERLDELRKRIGQRDGQLSDSAEDIGRLREERLAELDGLR